MYGATSPYKLHKIKQILARHQGLLVHYLKKQLHMYMWYNLEYANNFCYVIADTTILSNSNLAFLVQVLTSTNDADSWTADARTNKDTNALCCPKI